MNAKCPQCGRSTDTSDNPFRPFCGERCRLVDLNRWISGTYRIPVKNNDEDEDGFKPTDEEAP
jgi:uncharacterized protein